MEKPTILVFGAGIGGITVADYLANTGFEVTALQKKSTPGGRCSQLIRDGHRFDTGPTLFLIPEVFSETFSALDEPIEDHLDLRRIDPPYHIHCNDGTTPALTSDVST